MPVHEYKCNECGMRQETNVPHGDTNPLQCFKCKKPMFKQVSMPAGIHFKGTGFYATDYKQ